MRLEKALWIDGAEAVAVFDAGQVTWWAGAREFGPDDAVAATSLVAAAGVLAGEYGDVLVTTATTFHVLRPMDGGGVAHLVLHKGTARLGMARHEFKVLLERQETPALPAAPRPLELPPAPFTLPRRRPSRPPVATAVEDVPPGWLALVGQPYETDEGVLDRILGTLKEL